jgi:hypothetical protein
VRAGIEVPDVADAPDLALAVYEYLVEPATVHLPFYTGCRSAPPPTWRPDVTAAPGRRVRQRWLR